MAKGLVEIDTATWQTVLQRDRLQDGNFVYVALTTGIYCRPSCPARHPHRRNVVIVESVAKAERLGYAACNIASTLGLALLAGTEEGICAILVGEDDQTVIRRLRGEFPMAVLTRKRVAPRRWTASIEACQREDPLLAKLPLEFRVRVFQAKVWKSLAGRNG